VGNLGRKPIILKEEIKIKRRRLSLGRKGQERAKSSGYSPRDKQKRWPVTINFGLKEEGTGVKVVTT